MAYIILCDEGMPFTAAELLNPHFVPVKAQSFLGAMEKRDGDVYVVTMSPAFSRSYEAACQAREKMLERDPRRKIFVLDSRTAFAGELAVARRLQDFLLSGCTPEDAALETQNYIESLNTVGVLDRTEVLREKSAFSRAGALIRTRLSRKLLLEGGQDGRLHVKGRSHGASPEELSRMALKRLGEKKPERCVITYSGCPEKAKELGRQLKGILGIRELVIVPADRLAARYMGTGTLMAAF